MDERRFRGDILMYDTLAKVDDPARGPESLQTTGTVVRA